MSKYRCDQCETTYSHEEYMALDKTLAVKDDTEPDPKHGYHKVCDCGAEFWVDRFSEVSEVDTADGEITVSTVFLHTPHGMNREDWYETCVFWDGGSRVVDRYETQELAEKGHEEICTRLKEGRYETKPTGRELMFP